MGFNSGFKGLSTVHEPPEDGLKNGPKHVGANFKCFNVNLVLFKVYIVCVHKLEY